MRTTRRLFLSMLAISLAGVSALADPLLVTDLVGDKDHLGPSTSYTEYSPPQVDPLLDPFGFDYGYHAGANVSWTHQIDVTNLTVASVRLDLSVIGLYLGPSYQKLYLDGVELPNAFSQIAPVATITGTRDKLQTFSFALDPSLLQDGDLLVRVWLSPSEGWGGVDWSELTVEATRVVPEPSPATLLILGLGLSIGLRRLHRAERS